ncbi:MAG: Mycobacteriophage Barnyard protein gp56 [Proteobacteria bacterium]|nr:Mycobacteriophage Barnyard protein gp56 [Pseudomonadota bacterium]
MAHLVQKMAYVGETPWHGLGNQLVPKQPLEVWAQQAGMAFQILETPVRYMAESAGMLGSIMTFGDQKVLYRSDTKAALSVVSNRFQVVQPREILEFYRDLTELSGFELETAGVLKEGRKVWALARTGLSASLKGNDTVNGYLLLATACDGTLATTAQFTSIRVVCNNTLAIALANGGQAVKVPHSTSFDAQAVKQQLGVSISSWDSFMYRMRTLSERKVKSHEAMNFFLRVFTDPNATATGLSNERAIKAVQTLYDGHGQGAELTSAKGTAWGLLNSVTEFVDHQRRARSQDYRLDSAWFGQGAVIKKKALDEALKMAA